MDQNTYIEQAAAHFRALLTEQLNRQERMAQGSPAKDFSRMERIVIGLIPGDGIGPILMAQARRVLEKLLAAGNETPPMTIRLNWLRVMKPDLIKNLQERGFTVEQGSLCQNALHVKGNNLLDSDMYKLGLFTPQDESSMLVA